MRVIGVTGGIGSGKTIVSRILEVMDIPVYYTDVEAKRLMTESPFIRTQLIDHFGEAVYENKQLNRPLLAQLIFNNESQLQFVNSVVHPEVRRDFRLWKSKQTSCSLVAVESAILFESGLHQEIDCVLSVTAPLSQRIDRVMKRDRASEEAVMSRINKQMSDEERDSRADHVILNDGLSPLIPQVEEVISRLNLIHKK